MVGFFLFCEEVYFNFFLILVLNRVKARLRNTEIRLEYVPPETDRGVALIIKIEK